MPLFQGFKGQNALYAECPYFRVLKGRMPFMQNALYLYA